MARYRFLSSASIEKPTAQAIASAKVVTDLAEIVLANKSQGEYLFTEEKGLAPLFGKILSAEVTTEMLPNGNPVNRLVVVTEKAGKQRMRCFGKGRDEIVPAQTLKTEHIKTLAFGFCTSDGERVCETRTDGATGEIKKTPVIYANVSAL